MKHKDYDDYGYYDGEDVEWKELLFGLLWMITSLIIQSFTKITKWIANRLKL